MSVAGAYFARENVDVGQTNENKDTKDDDDASVSNVSYKLLLFVIQLDVVFQTRCDLHNVEGWLFFKRIQCF